MIFNPDNTKLKYILGIHKDMPGYPTGEDILYYVIKRHSERETGDEITFTDNFIMNKLGNEYSETIIDSLNKLLQSGYIEITRETKDSTSYRVLINDYTDAI
jgi:hypothetical protein